ncbi:MAG: hypothetical protein RL272_524 [Candidatus Parcubacteria bacterium]|jgi:uncharacterized membrane protein YgcG
MMRYLAVLATVISTVAIPLSARAQDCDTMVVDATGRLGASGVATVEAAGNRLVNAGADVRVRVIPDSRTYGNLDQYMATMQGQCASWRAADGGRKNNLLVVLLSMDRQSGVFFGEQYRPALDGRTAGIRTNSMNPRFRDGDFAGGLSAGLDASGRLIAASAAPPVQTAPGPVSPPVVVHEQPTDLSGLWTVMGWGLGLVALGLLAYGIMLFARSRAKRRAAQQKAQAKRGACANRISELDQPLSLLGARISKAAKSVSEEDIKPLRDELEGIKAIADRTTGQFADLQGAANNPDRNGLSEAEYDGMTAEFQQVLDGLDSVSSKRDALEKKLQGLQAQIDAAQPAIDALDAEIKIAAAAIAQIQEQGFKTDAEEAVLAEAMKSLEDATAAFGAKRFGAVKTACAKGSAKAKEASVQANALPKRKADIEAAVLSLKKRLPDVQAAIQSGRGVFEEVSSGYAEGCWSSIRGNGTEAVKRLEAATRGSVEAAVAGAMDRQEWQKAEAVIVQANAWLDEAESFMRSISSLKAALERAKQDAQPEIDAAQADIDKAKAYERQYDADIRDTYKAEIARDQELLDQAKAELARQKPDYIRAVKLAKEANATADKILAECQGEHEAAERQRRLAVSEVRDADAAISRAKEYVEDHSSDVGSGAEEKLKAARATLKRAKETGDLASRISLAQQAHKEADAAYKKAKSDVSDAEDERERARAAARRAASSSSSSDAFAGGLIGGIIGSSISSGSSSGSSGGGFGGWGSSSGGGDSGGWGGSSGGGDSGSFGSSGGGGGDSGGW